MRLEDIHTGMRVRLADGVDLLPPCSRTGEVVGLRLSRRGKERVMFLPDSTPGEPGARPVLPSDLMAEGRS